MQSQVKILITDCRLICSLAKAELADTMELFSCQKKSGEDETSDTLKGLGGDADI